MEKIEVIKNITKRTGGDIYLGVVGAVRTGKSTFIRKFMENLVIPIKVEDFTANIRMIDCVGYVVKAAKGYEDENGPRLVMTPWVLLNK